MRTFSHSGTTGDTFSSLSAVKILGGGDFYLKLHNLEPMIREKLGWPDVGRHKGRMTIEDYESIRDLMLHQPYINRFEPWNGQHIDHELENAALYLEPGVIPRNFPNQHARANNIDIVENFKQLQIEPYMECREPRSVPGRPIAVFRNPYYQDGNDLVSSTYLNLIERGLAEQAFYIGLDSDHAWFEDTFKIKIPHVPTPDFMEMARLIQGSELLITNMSSACALGLGLGKTMWIETRKLPTDTLERLETYYPYRINISYF